MEVLFPCCAGLDVHKRSVVACRIRSLPAGETKRQIQTFGTTTPELLRLLAWLQEGECTHAAMESTGEFWRPVYYLLEAHLTLLLVNARHIKAVPGRKTDVKDAEWIADLLRHGLLKASFVPPPPQRDLRDLTRQRVKLVEERARVVNRVQKVLESANLKLASVATDIMGVSARAMLAALIDGESDPTTLAELAQGRLRAKRAELIAALTGKLREHHRFLLVRHGEHIRFLEQQIAAFDQKIVEQIERMSTPKGPGERLALEALPEAQVATPPEEGETPLTFQEAVPLLDGVPGIDTEGAQKVLSELGTDMRQYPSAGHAASWAGLAPGNNESAGKQRSGKAPPGNGSLRKALVQAAHGAVRTKGSRFGAMYRRVVKRRGKQRALVAVARALLVVIYQMLKTGERYREMGENYLERRSQERAARGLIDRLEKLGYHVTIESRPTAAAA